MVGEGVAQQHHQPDNPQMLRLQEKERQAAALIDQEEPVLVGGILPGDDGRPSSERKWHAPAAARLRQIHQLRMRFSGQQVGTLGVGEHHLEIA